ncbi:MAG: tRNA lysidine(34) synthetase TilS [Candidatus Eutrophobiaceae bacterium]
MSRASGHSLSKRLPVPDDIAIALNAVLGERSFTGRLFLGLSGGVDSSVLLHLAHCCSPALRQRVQILHVDHGLHPQSPEWAAFCRARCAELDLPLSILKVNAPVQSGESIEAWAREQRYALMAGEMQEGDILLVAHHADDQAETVMMNLLRGAGAAGLAGMRTSRRCAGGWLVRPLLPFTCEQILAYAKHWGLSFLCDPTNEDRRFPRNFLRKEILPALSEHWPGFRVTLLRAARQQASMDDFLHELAQEDLARVRVGDRVLDIGGLCGMPSIRQAGALRCWLADLTLPTPSEAHIGQIRNALMAAPGRIPRVAWRNVDLRRYRKRLYALPEPVPSVATGTLLHWNTTQPLELPLGRLVLRQAHSGEERDYCIALPLCDAEKLHVRFRVAGMQVRLGGRRHSSRLKHLMQEHGILPWYRDLVPLVYLGEELLAIPILGINAQFHRKKYTPQWELAWQCPCPVLAVDREGQLQLPHGFGCSGEE